VWPRPASCRAAERKREAARQDISDTALRLFIEHGYEATTIDQIAARVGLSARSVFRHFTTKEDIVLAQLNRSGERLHDALRLRPPAEPAWDALRQAFDVLLADHAESPDRLRRIITMVQESPLLHARHLEQQPRWQEPLVPLIAARLGVPDGHPSPRALVAAAFTCLDVAVSTWAAHDDGTTIGEVLDTIIATVRGT